jgi:hypothetical protein
VARAGNVEHQTLETLINEEAMLFAKYLRAEKFALGSESRIKLKKSGCALLMTKTIARDLKTPGMHDKSTIFPSRAVGFETTPPLYM